MRTVLQWIVVAVVLSTTAAIVLDVPDSVAPVGVQSLEPVAERVRALAAATVAAPLTVERAVVAESLPTAVPGAQQGWCEPVEPIPCVPELGCGDAPDGTRRLCVRQWYVKDSTAHVCVVGYPSKAVRTWRSNRLRVLVNEICKRRDGCDPVALHDYLSVLALRESTWRPYKAHRLAGDLDANAKAWAKQAGRYAESPAANDPTRWAAGLGYYGQNPALLLGEWDASAIPETLCGEVESTLVHLRTARRRRARLASGVTCDGREHHGTATGDNLSTAPGWYDVSLANSGSNPCPAKAGRALEIRRGFERRASRRGLDPYGPVTPRMLGRPVPRDEQAAFARDVRARMDREFPAP